MNTEQKLALQSLVGRDLTAGDEQTLDPLVAERNDVAIAALLSVGRTRITQPRLVGEGTISAALGVPAGPVFIYILGEAAKTPIVAETPPEQGVASAMVRQAHRLITDKNFDVGLPSVRAGLDAFVGKLPGFTQTAADAIKALAVVSDPVPTEAVSRALNLAEGRMVI